MRKFLPVSIWAKNFLLASIFCGWLYPAQSQDLKFHLPFDSLQSGNNYYLVGQLGRNNLVLYTTGANKTGLLICDSNGNAVERKILPLPGLLLNSAVIPSADHFDIVFQQKIDNTNYIQVARFDKNGETIKPPKIIDSSRIDLLGPGAYYTVGGSENNNFTLLYRLLHGLQKDQLLVSYLLLDSNTAICDSRNFYIPFNHDLDTVSPMYVNPAGTVLVATHDKANSYKLGATVNVYQTMQGMELKKGSFYIKENKPVAFSFASGPGKDAVYLGAMSFNFYKKEVDGVVAARYNLASANADTNFYFSLPENFDGGLLKEISGISIKNLKKRLVLGFFDVDDKDNFSFALSFVSQKKTRNNFGRAPRRSGPAFSLNSSTPSQSMDGIRNYAGATALPANTTGYTAEMNQYLQKMTLLQDRGITSAPAASSVAREVPMQTRQVGAPNEALFTFTADPTMVYRTYFFSVDSGLQKQENNWEQHLYLPHAPVLTSTLLKANNEVSMLHYIEIKNERMLAFKPLQRTAEPAIIGKPTDPMLFFGHRYVIAGNSKLLSLYLDRQLRIGLASMKIE